MEFKHCYTRHFGMHFQPILRVNLPTNAQRHPDITANAFSAAMVKVLGDIPWLQDGSTASAIVKDAASRKLNTGYGVYPHLNTDEPRPQRTVACRGTELFVAKDNEIRCLNLQVIKATAEEETEEKSYKVRCNGKSSCALFTDCYARHSTSRKSPSRFVNWKSVRTGHFLRS